MQESVSREEFNDLAERHQKALSIVATAKAENVALLVCPHPPLPTRHLSTPTPRPFNLPQLSLTPVLSALLPRAIPLPSFALTQSAELSTSPPHLCPFTSYSPRPLAAFNPSRPTVRRMPHLSTLTL